MIGTLSGWSGSWLGRPAVTATVDGFQSGVGEGWGAEESSGMAATLGR
ncbi:hypothetical protein GCM10027600_24550 [Nocardioides ginsengisegetis]